MPGSCSWMHYAPQGVKGFDDASDGIRTRNLINGATRRPTP